MGCNFWNDGAGLIVNVEDGTVADLDLSTHVIRRVLSAVCAVQLIILKGGILDG